MINFQRGNWLRNFGPNKKVTSLVNENIQNNIHIFNKKEKENHSLSFERILLKTQKDVHAL